jgi:hypothetical protein
MPNLVPADVHVNQPVGTEGKDSFGAAMDRERKVRNKKQKKKIRQIEYSPDWVEKMIDLTELVQKKFHSAQNRRDLASSGDALSDGSYPIADQEDLHSAAVLARSGHGNVAGAKRLIARRAKELGVKNPLDKDGGDVNKSSSGLEMATSCFSRLTE